MRLDFALPTQNDCVDFTLPSSAAFARHLQREAGAGVAQSTPFVSRQPPPVFTDDDVTSVRIRKVSYIDASSCLVSWSFPLFMRSSFSASLKL